MRHWLRLLCVCALLGVGCQDGECSWNFECEEDDNICTEAECEQGSCVTKPFPFFVPCADEAVCLKGECVELGGNCTMADFDYKKPHPLYSVPNGCHLGIGAPMYYAIYDCYEAWADASIGTELECVDFVTNCYFQNPKASVSRDCFRCLASGYCCYNLCTEPELASCPDQMYACMLGEQAPPSGG